MLRALQPADLLAFVSNLNMGTLALMTTGLPSENVAGDDDGTRFCLSLLL